MAGATAADIQAVVAVDTPAGASEAATVASEGATAASATVGLAAVGLVSESRMQTVT
ncbi:hypothetical protein [Mycobacterium sp.]|uniref:hypothetical protein n=1 Tax=Mycobacterium sp. TaxID=1785 RepID=UPI003C7221A5